MTTKTFNILNTIFRGVEDQAEDFLYFYDMWFAFKSLNNDELVQVELIYDTVNGQQNDIFNLDYDSCLEILEDLSERRRKPFAHEVYHLDSDSLDKIYSTYHRINTVSKLIQEYDNDDLSHTSTCPDQPH